MREWRSSSECNVEAELCPGTSKPLWSVPLTHALVYLCLLFFFICIVVVVQSPGRVWLFAAPWTEAHQASLSLTTSRNLPTFMFMASVMLSSCLILWCPLLLTSIFPSIRDFSNESSVRIRWPKYWSFSFTISPSNEDSGLISFKIDWFDLLAVQGTFRSLFQHHSSKASFLWHSAFLMAQLSQLYVSIQPLFECNS